MNRWNEKEKEEVGMHQRLNEVVEVDGVPWRKSRIGLALCWRLVGHETSIYIIATESGWRTCACQYWWMSTSLQEAIRTINKGFLAHVKEVRRRAR